MFTPSKDSVTPYTPTNIGGLLKFNIIITVLILLLSLLGEDIPRSINSSENTGSFT